MALRDRKKGREGMNDQMKREAPCGKCCARTCREKAEAPLGCQGRAPREKAVLAETGAGSSWLQGGRGAAGAETRAGTEHGWLGSVWGAAVGCSLSVNVSVLFCSFPSDTFFLFPLQTTRYGLLSFFQVGHRAKQPFPIQTWAAVPGKGFCWEHSSAGRSV